LGLELHGHALQASTIKVMVDQWLYIFAKKRFFAVNNFDNGILISSNFRT